MPSTPSLSERQPRHWQLLLLLVVLWGSSFATNKIAVETITPIWVVALRIVIGAAIMLVYMWARGQRLSRTPTHWLWFIWLGGLGTVLPFLLISWGVLHVPSSIAGILMAAVPLGVIVLAHMLLPDERLTMRKAAGFLIGFAGVTLLVGLGGFATLEAEPLALWALLAITGAAFCYALNGTTARLMPDMANTPKSSGVLLAAALIALPLAVILEPSGLVNASWRSLWAVLALAIFPTALATIILFWMLKEVGASFVAISNYLVPVFAVLVGVIGLGERLQWSDWMGLALVLCGILVSEGRRARRAG